MGGRTAVVFGAMVGVVRLRFLDGAVGLGEGGTEESGESELESISPSSGSRLTDDELNG